MLSQQVKYPPDSDGTARLKGYFDALAAVCPERFGRWRVQEAIWCGKAKEYIPYADGVAYLAQNNFRTEQIRNDFDFDNWVARINVPVGEFGLWLQGQGGPSL